MRKVQLTIKQEEVAPATTSDLVVMSNGNTLKEELSTSRSDQFSSAQTVTTSIEKIADGAYGGVYESGVMYGRTLVNLVSGGNEQKQVGESGSTLAKYSFAYQLDHTKTYTLYFEVSGFVGSNYFNVSMSGGSNGGSGTISEDGTYKLKITPSSSNEGKMTAVWFYWERSRWSDENQAFVKNVMVLEGDYTNQESPFVNHFEGICDVKMPALRNAGKNLFDSSQIIQNKAIAWASGDIVTLTNGSQTHENFIPINYKSTYSVSGCNYIAICFYDANKQPVGFLKHSSKNEISQIGVAGATQVTDFNVSNYPNVRYMRITIRPNNDELRDISTLQIEESSTATTYEEYKTNILRTPETVTLRSLPNGVRDELNVMTGEYIKRIGEVVFDGSETWYANDLTKTNTSQFRMELSGRKPGVENMVTNMFVTKNTYSLDEESVFGSSTANYLYVRLLKSKLTEDSLTSFKQYLFQNPITVQYELETPVTTKVVLTQSEPIVKIGTELPNGVCDTYNLLTGEHIQRVGKVVLDGSEAWTKVAFPSTNTTHCYSSLKIENLKIPNVNEKNIVSDRFQTVPQENYNYNNEEMYTWRAGELLYVNILRSRLSTSDVQGLKAWLKENPTTVWYELKTPIVTKKNGLPNTHGVTLPNGEADKYNESTGVYTQNLGKVVLNGSQDEEWAIVSSLSLTNTIAFQCMLSQGSSLRADNLICNSFTPQEGSSDVEHIRSAWAEDGVYKAIALFINKTKLPTQDVSGLRSYLASNNIELYYLLPASKTIDIPLINVGQVLPNGVCDTYNPITKEYVKRVNKVMFDGSETWLSYGKWDTTNTSAFYLSYENGLPPARRDGTDGSVYSIGYCDRFNYKSYNDFQNKVDIEGTIVYGGRDGEGGPGKIFSPQFSIKNSRLTTVDVDGFKTWLHNSNITYYYELATPETSFVDIDLSTLYSGVPVAYKNGHILLESGHEGQSLLPELTYSVPTSKTGVLSTTSKTILKHEERLSSFEKLLLRESVMMDYRLARSIFNEL